MIKLDIGSIPEGPSHVDLSGEASELGVTLDGGRLESRIEVELDATRTGNDIFLKGRARVKAVLDCARCLEEFTYILQTPIELWCVVRGGGEDVGDGERENLIEVPAGMKYVDLSDHLRSELLVLIPLKPLCKDDCKGLCPTCGVNLNLTACSCERELHDGRWDALKDLK